ncbi:hypothetical protein JLBYU08_75 [Escherichia phage JLBYU08]|nr:hypothetical protein JLBYU08_75 [Escherichia phage JLBYU08]
MNRVNNRTFGYGISMAKRTGDERGAGGHQSLPYDIWVIT